MTVRFARESDMDRLREFDTWKQATLERIQSGECLVAERDGMVSAYMVVNRNFFGRHFVAFVIVAPEARRSGICGELLAHVESQCPDPKLWISTALTNTPMQTLLEKREYRLTGVVHDLGDAPELIYYKQVGP
jgi:N-acetylglutamate synthase-like GNAT family acetyltransferase